MGKAVVVVEEDERLLELHVTLDISKLQVTCVQCI